METVLIWRDDIQQYLIVVGHEMAWNIHVSGGPGGDGLVGETHLLWLTPGIALVPHLSVWSLYALS